MSFPRAGKNFETLSSLRMSGTTHTVCRIRESGLDIAVDAGIVIDEVSFISAAFIGMISQRFADIMGHPELPFGGIPVLLVGDNFQKAPVTGMPWFVSWWRTHTATKPKRCCHVHKVLEKKFNARHDDLFCKET